jgi:hypothetical protein
MTLTNFCSTSHISPVVIRAVVRQVGGWDAFQGMAQDVTNHGASGGFSGFTYYKDTFAFTRRVRPALLEMAKQMASDLGEDLYTMIGNFNCLKITATEAAEGIHNPRHEERTNVYNAMAWFALEEVCRSYVDLAEGE